MPHKFKVGDRVRRLASLQDYTAGKEGVITAILPPHNPAQWTGEGFFPFTSFKIVFDKGRGSLAPVYSHPNNIELLEPASQFQIDLREYILKELQ